MYTVVRYGTLASVVCWYGTHYSTQTFVLRQFSYSSYVYVLSSQIDREAAPMEMQTSRVLFLYNKDELRDYYPRLLESRNQQSNLTSAIALLSSCFCSLGCLGIHQINAFVENLFLIACWISLSPCLWISPYVVSTHC
jgi:hypothetical protein